MIHSRMPPRPSVLVLGTVLGLGVCSALAAPPERTWTLRGEPPVVVLLFAQRTTAPAVVTMDEAFRREIERSYERPIDLHVEYLDIPDDRDTVYRDRLVDLLRAKYQGRPVGVVVAVRLESLRFTLEHRQQVFGGAPVVFADVTRGEVRPLALPPDAIGVFRELTGQETVNIALDLCPEARRVVVVCGTSKVDEGNEAYVRRLVEARSPGLEVVSTRGLALEEQLRRVSQLPRDSVVIFASYRTDSQGRSKVAREKDRRDVR